MRHLNNWLALMAAGVLMAGCAHEDLSQKVYNQGINIIPVPSELKIGDGKFILGNDTRFYVDNPEAQSVCDLFKVRLQTSTGYAFQQSDAPGKGCIELFIAPDKVKEQEGYSLEVTADNIKVYAATPQGIFYGLTTLMQLLPAEIESPELIKGVIWSLPAVSITDSPRFPYRGLMVDVARHFTTVEGIKRHIDMLASFKMNRLHLHLTDFQGWRVEIKKYPKLTSVGATRIDEYGNTYSGYYTQDQIREIVAYAAERFVTIIPEIDVPGHSLAAIAAYPELSCTGEQYDVMSRWGPFPVVFCPGKEDMFEFLDNVFAELAPLFPSEYFHIGGDECPKEVWKTCKACQQRIDKEHLRNDPKHPAEHRLQSYAITRCEQLLKKYGKKMIGWDEILEGGLAPDATVMSWRGEKGGIAAALMDHQVIMTPGSGGLYLDHYQGDPLADNFAWGAYAPISKTYAYDPVPDTLTTMDKEDFILGVQGNSWSECMYTEQIVEYQTYPRTLAVAEVGWSKPEKKNFEDFSRRLNRAAVLMDMHGVNYHIPMPEQPGGSFSYLAFIDSLKVEFTSTRPVRMVYTLDGSTPDTSSETYSSPFTFTESATINIRSVLPSGKMSAVRTVHVDKQQWTESVSAKRPEHKGLRLKIADEKCMMAAELEKVDSWRDSTLTNIRAIAHLRPNFYKNVVYHVAVADGLAYIPEDGVYQFRSDNTRVWVGGKMAVDNDGKPQVNSKYGRGLALRKGWHTFKVEQISNFIGGWNSQQRNYGNVSYKKQSGGEWHEITPDEIGY